jgi:hypothetical protein
MSSIYARMIKSGDHGEGCEARAVTRLRTARSVLVGLVGEPEIAHHDHAFPAKKDGSHECDSRCRPVWPEWVTDEMFERAVTLACDVVTRRGEYNRGGRIAA